MGLEAAVTMPGIWISFMTRSDCDARATDSRERGRPGPSACTSQRPACKNFWVANRPPPFPPAPIHLLSPQHTVNWRMVAGPNALLLLSSTCTHHESPPGGLRVRVCEMHVL